MPWFESSKDKQFRELVQGKMEICLTKPDKYAQAFPVLDSLVCKPNQKAIEMIVDHIKQVIKDDDYPPVQKLQSIHLLRDLMQSKNKALGKYVVVKILKRLAILAQHRKNQKDENRGANIFKCKKSEQKYGIQFLKTLLLCLSDWGKNWPRHADGPFHDFQSAYNDLLMEKQVAFPPDQKRISKSPAPGGMRTNVKQQYASPPKISQQKTKIQNPLSKPSIKQRKPASGPFLQYVNSMIEILNLLSTTLIENPQFGEIWGIIKAYIDQFKAIDEQGNLILAQMIDKGDKNTQMFQTIQNNSTFIAELIKDTDVVDRKNQSYTKYNGKYVKNCKRLVLTLSIYTDKPDKPSGSSIPNNNSLNANTNKLANQTSINQKVQQKRIQKPRAQIQRNRYGSSNQLKNQLQLNLQPIKKEDFNSGTLTNKHNQNSEGSNRYNSVSQNQNDKNRQSLSQFNISKEKEKEKEKQKQKKQAAEIQNKKQEIPISGLDLFFGKQQNKKQNVKQISKITQKNQGQSQINFDKFDFDKDVPKNQKKSAKDSFSDFQVPKQKEKNQKFDSNSNFFKQVQMVQDGKMQTITRKNRKIPNKKTQQADQNYFDISIKNQSQNLSGFQKSNIQKSSKQDKSKQKQISQQIKNQHDGQVNSKNRAFDTFKSPNELVKAMDQLKKVENKSQYSKKSRDSLVSNPFQTKQKNQQSFFKNNISNPFEAQDNPFALGQNESKIKIQQNQNDDNKSKSSNPFSSKNDISKSHQKSSIKSKPPISKKKSQISNPFDTKSQRSQTEARNQKPANKMNENPFQTSQISNPFQQSEKKLPSDKQLSQRNSFINIDPKRPATSVKNPSNIIDDPFTQFGFKAPQVSQIKKQTTDKLKTEGNAKNDKSFQGYNFQEFMNASQHKSLSQSVKAKEKQKQKQKQIKKSLEQSGFNFSEFGDVKNQQNSAENNSFQPKNSLEQGKNISKQSSFNFFNVNENKDEVPSKHFFFKSKQSIKQPVPQKLTANNKIVNKDTFQGFQYGFDDFQNVSKNSNTSKNLKEDSVKNPFAQFQISKSTLNAKKLSIQSKKNQSKQQISWSKFQKQSLSASDEWNKFNNIIQKHSSQEKTQKQLEKQINQSRYQPSERKPSKQDMKQIEQMIQNNNQIINEGIKRRQPTFSQNNFYQPQNNFQKQQKQPYFGNYSSKSISLQFEEPSPFQKKQICWQFIPASAPSSTRYNITPDNLAAKKQQLMTLLTQNKTRLDKYKQMNNQLTALKKNYVEQLQRIGKTKQQKQQFKMILKRLIETNEIKEKQIQQLIKKIKKTEQIKRKILQNQRILFQKSKQQQRLKEYQLQSKGKVTNKWQKFNNNLKKQRQSIKIEKTITNLSYYM